MQTSNEIAFKEWAVICDALQQGRQSLILRKGGIHEGRSGFRVAHSEFWLFPTYLHESEGTDRIVDESRRDLERVVATMPPADQIAISLYAVVTDVHELTDPQSLVQLTGQHIWSHRSIDEKFHYRQPGLFALTVRIYQRETPIILPNSPHFAGCRSWVDLPSALETRNLFPVLNDADFESQQQAAAIALNTRPV
jgi:hypothetical protein